MRTAKEEALARLKEVQAKLLQAGGVQALPADQVNSVFKEFTDGVIAVLQKEAVTDAATGKGSHQRKISFSGVGDQVYRNAEFVASLPKDVQVGMDNCYLISRMARKPIGSLKSWDRLLDGSSELKKALDTAEAAGGAEWIPTGFSSELIANITAMAGVEQMHPHIVMPTNPYVLPIQAGRLTAYKVSEQTADTGQTAGTKSSGAGLTGNLSLSAAGIQAEVLTSKNLEEDSIIPILPILREEIVMAVARAIEEACVNGDTTASHQDSDTTGSDDRRKLWKGYRKHALANSYSVDFGGAGNGFDFETWNKVRGKLGKYGVNPSRLFWLVSLNMFFKSLGLKDAGGHPVVITIDKFPGATSATGTLGFLTGMPVLVSEFARDDLNASGVYDAATTSKSAIYCVYRDGFVFGDRRDVTMQVLGELYAEYQQDALLVTMRKDFQPLRAIASNAPVAIGYDMANS